MFLFHHPRWFRRLSLPEKPKSQTSATISVPAHYNWFLLSPPPHSPSPSTPVAYYYALLADINILQHLYLSSPHSSTSTHHIALLHLSAPVPSSARSRKMIKNGASRKYQDGNIPLFPASTVLQTRADIYKIARTLCCSSFTVHRE